VDQCVGLQLFSPQNTKDLSWSGRLSPTSNMDVLHVKMLNRVLKRERERKGDGRRALLRSRV
jgi:hypothetical protein